MTGLGRRRPPRDRSTRSVDSVPTGRRRVTGLGDDRARSPPARPRVSEPVRPLARCARRAGSRRVPLEARGVRLRISRRLLRRQDFTVSMLPIAAARILLTRGPGGARAQRRRLRRAFAWRSSRTSSQPRSAGSGSATGPGVTRPPRGKPPRSILLALDTIGRLRGHDRSRRPGLARPRRSAPVRPGDDHDHRRGRGDCLDLGRVSTIAPLGCRLHHEPDRRRQSRSSRLRR